MNNPDAAPPAATPEKQIESAKQQWPKPLGEDAYIGFAGEFVLNVMHHTEADPAALLFQLLVCFGNCIGTNAFYRQEWTMHHAREFVLIVGKSAKARKGTSWNIIKEIFRLADENWSKKRIVGGLGSGEGVVNCVRDDSEDFDERGNQTIAKGIQDKRLMVVESEFASVLSVSGREGSTLSEVLRNAWDSGNIQTVTKNNSLRATAAHISVIGHITETELGKKMDSNAIFNGFGNRFLPVCAKRARLLPDGGSLTDEDFKNLARKLSLAIDAARKISRLTRNDEARARWHEVYPKLTADRLGNFGAITSRAEAHALRLSMIYALVDGKSEISAIEAFHSITKALVTGTDVKVVETDWLKEGRTTLSHSNQIARFLLPWPPSASSSSLSPSSSLGTSSCWVFAALSVLQSSGVSVGATSGIVRRYSPSARGRTVIVFQSARLQES